VFLPVDSTVRLTLFGWLQESSFVILRVVCALAKLIEQVDFPLAIHDRFRSTTCGFYSPTTQSIGSLSTFSSIVFVAEKSGHDFLYPTRKMEGFRRKYRADGAGIADLFSVWPNIFRAFVTGGCGFHNCPDRSITGCRSTGPVIFIIYRRESRWVLRLDRAKICSKQTEWLLRYIDTDEAPTDRV